MGINIRLANSQANKISDYVDTLKYVRDSLNNFKASLNSQWQAQEMIYVNNAIDSISREISTLSSNLHSLRYDIVATAREIKREEEARAAEAARVAQLKNGL